ncbi:MAG: hypothetical protein ABIF87_05060 [Pseudomonadota bacterium]
MKTIVIVTIQPGPDSGVLAAVKTLFPDCEINVVYKGVETFEQLPAPRPRRLRFAQERRA